MDTRFGRGIDIPNEDVTRRANAVWEVLSSRGRLRYCVKWLTRRCISRGCPNGETDICSHKYSCDCADVVNPCKHIYKVHYMRYFPDGEDAASANLQRELFDLLEKAWQIVASHGLSREHARRMRRRLGYMIFVHESDRRS